MADLQLTPFDHPGQPPVPYSQAILATGAERTLFVSGQVGVAPDGSVPDDVGGQARNAIAALESLLAQGGMSTRNLAKITIYLTDAAHVPDFMAAAGGALPDPPPATTLLVVQALADPRLLVEIEAIAVA